MVRRSSRSAVSRPAAVAFGLLMALGASLLLVPIIPGAEGLHEGEVAPRTIEAARSITYDSAALTEQARDTASAGVEPVLLPADAAVRSQQVEKLIRLLDQIRIVRGRTDLTASQQLDEVNALSLAAGVSNQGRVTLLFLDRASFESVGGRAQRALAELLDKGVRQGEVNQVVRDYLAQVGTATTPGSETSALTELLLAFVVPNVQVDQNATQQRRDAARNAVSGVTVTYSRGQVVIREGETIERDDIEALEATGVVGHGFDLLDALAGVLVALGFGLALAVAARAPGTFGPPSARRMLLVGSATIATLAGVRFGMPEMLPDNDVRYLMYAIPFATAPIVATVVGNQQLGLVVALLGAFVAAFIGATVTDLPGAEYIGPLESLRVAMAFGAGGFAGVVVVSGANRLGRFLMAAPAVFAAVAAVLLAFWLMAPPQRTEDLIWIAVAAGVHGLSSAILATGIVLAVSLALGIPTRYQLFELAHSDHPLLRRLQEEAPGTYHHCLTVGALAERAAASIGADALLARVGAYYHDIGKLGRPDCFIENLTDVAASPHAAFTFEESAAIIRAHVTDGLDLARRNRLPHAVRDFIPQHHGTRLVAYFHRQAVAAGGSPDRRNFQYPGPKPQTRETAIVMLADSCEAVVRAARERTQSRIDALVDDVLAERLAEGQFDECDITLRELQVVASAFKATLRAIYHPRIEYPQPGPEELAAVASGP